MTNIGASSSGLRSGNIYLLKKKKKNEIAIVVPYNKDDDKIEFSVVPSAVGLITQFVTVLTNVVITVNDQAAVFPLPFSLNNNVKITFDTATADGLFIFQGNIEPSVGGKAFFNLKDTAGGLLDTGEIEAGETEDIVAPNATAVLKDTAGTILSTTALKSNETKDLQAPNATAVLKDSTGETLSNTVLKSNETKDISAPNATAVLKDSAGATLSTTVIKSNESKNISAPDATAVLKDTAGATLSTTPLKSNETKNIQAPNATAILKNSQGTPLSSTALKSNETKDVLALDADIKLTNSLDETILNAVIPSGATYSDTLGDAQVNKQVNGVLIELVPVPASSGTPVDINFITPDNGIITKTGKITGNIAGDDGNAQRGRLVDYWTLEEENPFGNTLRFTGLNGGGYNGAGYVGADGVTDARRDEVYIDDVILDWAHYDRRTGKIPMWVGNDQNLIDEYDVIRGTFNGLTADGQTAWCIPNIMELLSIINWEGGLLANPLFVVNSNALLSSTEDRSRDEYFCVQTGGIAAYASSVTNVYSSLPFKYYTWI